MRTPPLVRTLQAVPRGSTVFILDIKFVNNKLVCLHCHKLDYGNYIDTEAKGSIVFIIPMAPSCGNEHIARVLLWGQRDAKFCGSHWLR